ncbi:MAG: hypothetical protein ACKVS6_04275 [Planctomycetota bacterium]
MSQRKGTAEALAADKTTQGLYIFDSDGKLFEGWNHRGSPQLIINLKKSLEDYKVSRKGMTRPDDGEDPETERRPPKGTVIIDTFAKITEATYPKQNVGGQTQAFRDSTGRDHFWITKSEANSLTRGKLQKSLSNRLVRFHLNDFTRGEPNVWKSEDVKKAEFDISPDGRGYKVTGNVELSADRGSRGYVASIFGYIESESSKVTRFDIVAKGKFHGLGTFTKNGPPGEFTLVIAFKLAPEGIASIAPPQGIADFAAYLRE